MNCILYKTLHKINPDPIGMFTCECSGYSVFVLRDNFDEKCDKVSP